MKAMILTLSRIIDSQHGAREHYRIPKYQRDYTWGKKNWEALVQDIQENDTGYFVGAVIVVKDTDDDVHGCQTVFEVVDGQQRLTTLSLLMLALYERMISFRETAEFEDDDERSYYERCVDDLRSKLVLKVRSEEDLTEHHNRGWLEKGRHCYLRVQPSTQKDNFDDYRHALGQVGLIAATPTPKRFGNRRISLALNYFREHLPTNKDSALSLLAKINQLQFVFITVGSQADAFTLFETLNNRGVPLSAIDIIKNKMLSEMQKQVGISVDESYDQWQTIVENVEDPKVQERFLRHFYNANHWNELIRVSGITRANRAKIISIYEKVTTRNPQAVFDLLCSAAEHYGSLNSPDEYELPDDIEASLLDLKRINAAPAYQLLLFLMMKAPETFVEDDFIQKTIDLLRKFYVRRNVTDEPGTSALDQSHVDTIAACQKVIDANGKLDFDFLRSQVLAQDAYASMERFRDALRGNMYDDNKQMARYLLIKLDEQHHNREYAPDLWARNSSDDYIWTIEHVLPQSENLNKQWIQDLGNGDPKLAAELHAEHVDLLGNLTLSGYNARLSNASFANKQARADKKVGGETISIGYRNKLALNAMPFPFEGEEVSLATANTWNADMIQARTEYMVDRLIEMFSFDHELSTDC